MEHERAVDRVAARIRHASRAPPPEAGAPVRAVYGQPRRRHRAAVVPRLRARAARRARGGRQERRHAPRGRGRPHAEENYTQIGSGVIVLCLRHMQSFVRNGVADARAC